MNDVEEITQALIKFRNERDWEQFHNPKDLAIALSIEANELLELFLWKNAEEAKVEKVKEELSQRGLVPEQINKIKRNGEKYPVEKAKGNAKKYNEL